ncbi:hypothetical protein [Salinispora vitiensis]|uniref:hypothetical protein n=1 Tax=Salinispora vitiensis TaxID=999544 RepID=UPI0003692C28|nr:hypothetical protein [Salinispora vitiensis]
MDRQHDQPGHTEALARSAANRGVGGRGVDLGVVAAGAAGGGVEEWVTVTGGKAG